MNNMEEEKFYSKFMPKKFNQKNGGKKSASVQKNGFKGEKKDQRFSDEKKRFSETKKEFSAAKKFSPSASASGDSGNQKKPGNQRYGKIASFSDKKANKSAHAFSYEKSGSLFNARASQDELSKTGAEVPANLDSKAYEILQNFDSIIQNVRPLNSRQIHQLPDNIRTLSHQLTDDRSSRRLGYMNENTLLSSYVRYYTWWNLVRLTNLFSNLPDESFPENDTVCIDLGSGPLTVVIALWLARPDLRKLNLTWYCLDVSQNSLSFGEDIYLSIAAKFPDLSHWNIIRVKGSFGTEIRQKAGFITCANMLNELDQSSQMPPEFKTKQYFDRLKNYSSEKTKFLLVEPGVPKAARTISLLRDRFIADGAEILSPCTHCSECPMNGFKAYTGSQNKWCNFAFSTLDAPKKLQKLSEQAKLPKERAVLSFISVKKTSFSSEHDDENKFENKNFRSSVKKERLLTVRVASDEFSLPKNKKGIYGCCQNGLVLLRSDESLFASGDEIRINLNVELANLETDTKSGAKIIDL